MPFSTLGLRDTIVKALAEVGYSNPTPIQQQTIPVILQGKNLLAAAQTGTGKTASFVLPILERLADTQTERKKRIRALILTPTRELAVQVQSNIVAYAKHVGVSSFVIYGGVDDKPQKQALIDGVDILVATPGRLLDLYTQRAVHFDELEVLVLDEADRMLDMGFIEDINKIIDKLPSERQSLLFSATLSNQVRALAKTAIHRPVEISVIADKSSAPKISQWLTTVDKDKKSALLSHLINTQAWDQALIFIETKQGAAKLVSQLEKRDIEAECIHSGRSQPVREQILADFKSGKIKYLVATGIASRGIDIDDLSRVINYDLPYPADDYIHRIGRTGRAGAVGEAISFVSKDDFKNLCMIESRLGHLLERKVIEGFEPKKPVPESILNHVPKSRQNKPKTQDERPTLSLGKSKDDNTDFRKAKTQKAPVKKGPKPNPWNL
ncbi:MULTISPECIES: DEAD/DEAH box helicase [Shewanella]|uniref:DEAD/DEAH box helicase n=1 Tax=Shewanella metallivivens TaxID=2872342 RepID=A0ABT5THG7_9GAMM|nr:DEAD/DEAH box helicase [Shewanella metallivivens]MDD8058058.1 DEAD/DEAH box helicase [Shewanella metallivivens]